MDCHFELIPEDRAIQLVLKVLGFKQTTLGDNISITLNKIEVHFKNRFAIGLIDDDVRKPSNFFHYSERLNESDNLILLQKPDSRHFLIVIQPAIESWLFHCASIAEVRAEDFGFNGLESLKRVSKRPALIEKNQTFKNFLNTIYQKQSSGFLTLQSWIEDLFEKHHW